MKRSPGILVSVCAAGLVCAPAHASTIRALFSILPATVYANPGDVGDAFDVILTDGGPGSISVQSFSFEVSVTDPAITLTGANFSTTPDSYIFAGDSFDIDTSSALNTDSGQTLDASDLTNDGLGITLTSGESLALGQVLFNVAGNAAPGPLAVSFTGGTNFNNLSNPSGGNIPILSLTGDTIDVAPEPASAFLLGGALCLLGVLRLRR
jgi:hypothetical protein